VFFFFFYYNRLIFLIVVENYEKGQINLTSQATAEERDRQKT